jgi:L-amino acid N-acyltransferase YncA
MEDQILGYSYAGKWKGRCAYRNSFEATVYLSSDHVGNGIGSAPCGKLLAALKPLGIHMAIGSIALPNEANVRLHEKKGFEKAAHFEDVGFKFNRWIDVGYWQRIL